MSQGASGPHLRLLAPGTQGNVCIEGCFGDKASAARRVNFSLERVVNVEQETGQAASAVFQVFGMTTSGIETCIPAFVARA